ncbi:DUF4124 domain-containing protein [Janthinobacterium sp. 17J80-10]|uniref:DUF4124 domain-containing protein n=1 Tax=Janthinobacterium sp. 17J80-10 TaxID=2497863 RepID=UPI0010055640|nr:DUF4124 domain-containing protein [Janthinobacterium sp. 17J80-10]QAU34749.1 DUF4124 domain-containing protein [Janthinobacterium sp. 17J80-10]
MRLLISFVLLACPLPALAIYKCETGRTVSYGDTPCASGKSSTIATGPAGANMAPAPADFRLDEQRAELRRLQDARHRREAQDDKAAQKALRARAAKQKKCAKLTLQQKWREEDAAMAVGKAYEKARVKARRMAEEVQLECGQAILLDHLRQNRSRQG